MPGTAGTSAHLSVLLAESMRLLEPEKGGLFVDATLGLGGHTEAILQASPNTTVIGIDQDTEAVEAARKRLEPFGQRVTLTHANFSEVKRVVGGRRPQGIIADLGVSSMQMDSKTRGFSFRFDAPLDMRMDPSRGMTAAELLTTADEKEIADILYTFGEERASRKIARWIVERREKGEPLRTTFELAELVRRAVRTSPSDKIHPATRTFQALRIAVNNEIGILEHFIVDSIDLLAEGGVLAAIAFHSLEDRAVKQVFQRLSGKCSCPPRKPVCECGAVKKVEILTRKPVTATDEEIQKNPRSRSAKLRAVRRLDN